MIDLIPNSDQQEIADAIADFLHDTLPVERLREDKLPTEADDAIWSQLAELGCFGLSLPEELGGVGLSLVEEALCFREYGRYLLSPAMLGTVLAVKIAAHAGRQDLADALMAGKRRAGVGRVTPGGLQLFDVRRGDLAIVWDDDGAHLFDSAQFTTVQYATCIDENLAMTVVASPREQALITVAAAELALPQLASLLIAATTCGVLEGIKDMAVDYAINRTQFGMPIGAFQGIKHKCANIALSCEASWSQTAFAALCQQEATTDAAFQAANAMAISTAQTLDAAHENIQIHGGMGFTAEINAHLFLKRVHVLKGLTGDPVALRQKLLTLPAAA